MRFSNLFPALLVLLAMQTAQAAQCHATSGLRRVALLELYTSEGCDSCPPADRWLSSVPVQDFGRDRLVPLALHVDYWDYIGWKDRFAQPAFSARQRNQVQASGSRMVYTPQVLLNGRDFPAWRADALPEKLTQLNRQQSTADISLSLVVLSGSLEITASATAPSDAVLYLAVYQNDLSSEVRAGENQGVHLHHDYVVRELSGPIKTGVRWVQAFPFKPDWSATRMGVAAFVQNQSTGEIMQALRLPFCAG
jgi:hypothetical protein